MTAREHFEQGEDFRKSGNYEEAHAAYDKAIEIDPNDALPHNGKGNTFLKQGNYEEAHAAYDTAIKLDPDWAAPYYGKGNILQLQGQYEEAHTAYDTAIKLDPDWAAPYHGKGNTFFKERKYSAAHSAFDKAIRIDPNDALPHNGRGNVFSKQKKYAEAHAAYDKAIRIDPNGALPHNGKGNTFYERGEYEEAHVAYDRAIQIDPNNAVPHNGKGNAFYERGEYEEAHASFDKAIQIDPNYAKPYRGKGNVFFKQKKYAEAHAAYDKAIGINPKDANLHHVKGNAFYERGKYEEAHSAYDEAIEIDLNYAPSHNGKGNIFRKQGKYKEAHSAYDKAIKIDPNYANPHNGKGNTFSYQGEYEEAHSAYNKAIKIDPDDANTYNGKGHAFFAQGKYEEAHSAYDEAIKIDHESATPYHGKGNTFFYQKKYEEAHLAYDKAIKIDPNYADPHHGKAHLYLSKINSSRSIKHLNRRTILTGYNWLNSDPAILPLVPLFALKFIEGYGLPPWRTDHNHHEALKTAITFKALQVYQKEDNPLSKTDEALFNFYLGDQPASLQLFQEQLASQEDPTLRVCYYALRSSTVCITPLPEELSSKAEKAAINKVPEQTKGFLSFLKGKSTKLLPSEVKELYYAGLLLLDIDKNEEALPCFERIALQFPPARLASIKLKFDLGKTKQAEKELASFVTDHEAMNNIGRGLRKEFINPDTPLAEYLQRYAYHDELREATHFLSLRSRRLPNRIADGAKLGFFFEVYTFDTSGLNQIHQFFRTTYLKNFFAKFYDKELAPRADELLSREQTSSILEAVNKLPHSRAKEILERLEGLREDENRTTAIAEYFDAGELKPDKALLLNNYFFVNGHSIPYDKWRLDFYITEKAIRLEWQPSKPVESGIKGAFKKLVENPLGTIGETLAVLGSLALTGNILIGVGVKFTSSFLAELLFQYLKSGKSSFENFEAFQESFEVYIAELRETMGAERFRKRFPLELLQEGVQNP